MLAKKKPLLKKKSLSANTAPKKKITRFRTRVRSRHPSHDPLRTQLPLLPFRSVVRLGSTTVKEDDGRLVECNSAEAIRNSANKKLMKICFDRCKVKTADWCQAVDLGGLLERLKLEKFVPVVSKSLNGSRGRGNRLHLTQEQLVAFFENTTNLTNYIFEKYHDFSREYRLHVTKDGYFYACRKMLKNETPDDKRWFRNDSNSTWVLESNPLFNKPSNWNTIVAECVKALKAVGLDIGACDVKVQSAKDKKDNIRPEPEFIVIEINSAPSFGEVTLQKYLEIIPKILTDKHTK